MTSLDSSKGARYIAQLYEARCNGQWNDIPEFTRKVEKHAPDRRCLILSSKAGVLINQGREGFQKAEREYGNALSQALEQETGRQDLLDGLITRAAMLFGCGKYHDALVQIPETLHRSPFPRSANVEAIWTAVAVIQGTLVKGLSLEALGLTERATETYRSVIGYVSHVVGLRSPCLELRRWTEELLSHICLFFSLDAETHPAHLGEAMAAFHLLSKFLDDQSWRPLGTRASLTNHSPRAVWGAFYIGLSRIVKEDLVYHPSPVHRDHDTTEHRGLLEEDDFLVSRMQQRADLKRVEANYESLLLKDTGFPKADETNQEVRDWIELVMSNWRVLCGPNWTDAELGAGGKAAVGRSTLDILYRAATKTFHSTQILRHLFTIHAFLAEFDLAFKAFDTYAELISRGKARAEKSGEDDTDLDDDETALRLAAEAIRVACRYGAIQASEKALQISETLSDWLHKVFSKTLINSDGDAKSPSELPTKASPHTPLTAETAAIAYRAIGIAQAQHARATHDPQIRQDLQQKATDNFTKTMSLGLPDPQCTETLYAFALLLAEKRDVPAAIKLAKRALANPQETQALAAPDGVVSADEGESLEEDEENVSFTKQRKLLPVFHLLALLLCAREDYQLAAATCEAAFEQFGTAMNDLMSREVEAPSRQGTIGRRRRPRLADSGTLADMMDSYEKQAMLEIKMTQLALTELMEGTEAAVNATSGLFALYAALFGNINAQVSHLKPSKSAYNLPPSAKGSGGTMRSLMSKSKAMRSVTGSHDNLALTTSLPNTSAVFATRPSTSAGRGDSVATRTSHEKHHSTNHNTPSRSSSLRKKVGSIRGHKDHPTFSNTDIAEEKEPIDPQVIHMESGITAIPQMHNGSSPLRPIAHNMEKNEEPEPVGHSANSLQQDTRLPVPSPHQTSSLAPQFVASQARRMKMSLLIQVWLFVATLYINAGVNEDAKDAIEEANKLSSALELEVSATGCSVKNFQNRGWASGSSVEELWADVHAQHGRLLQSQSLPHDALRHFEQALSHQPDHREAIVELSTILLDYYCQLIPADKPDPAEEVFTSSSSSKPDPLKASTTTSTVISATANNNRNTLLPSHPTPAMSSQEMSPLELYRIAARDRAYGLLSSLTRLGSGWDSSKAWFVLARAYEESKQIEKAKEALWWTVELEDSMPIREWKVVNPGGYVL